VNPFIFFITMEMIGLKMALAITFSSVIVGIITGLFFRRLSRFPSFQDNPGTFADLSLTNKWGLSEETDTDENSIAMYAKVEKLAVMMESKTLENKWKAFFVQCIKMAKYPGKWFIISIILAAVVEEYIPSDWIVRFFKGHPYSILLAAAMAIPLYVCGGGAVPLVWDLMRAGMDQGAALSFFIAGPVTRIAPMITFIALLRYKAFGIYIGVSMALAIILGFLYRYV
jgi:uncharacterized membrane protein YraQ (UPF0718 family)